MLWSLECDKFKWILLKLTYNNHAVETINYKLKLFVDVDSDAY